MYVTEPHQCRKAPEGEPVLIQRHGAPQAASRKRRFPLDGMATTAVTFSRCLYAQLAQQAFQPPDGFPMPPAGNAPRKTAEIGMKLTVGMEIMCSSKARAERSAGPATVASPPVCGLCLARQVKCSARRVDFHLHPALAVADSPAWIKM
jgi:hypothetical protein